MAAPLPMLSGFLIGTSYIPFPPWALFFCLVPLFVFWATEPSAKRAFWGGWTAQFILNAIGFHWVAHTAYEFGHLPRPAAIVTLILFCATAHLYYPIAGWASRRLGDWRRAPEPARPLLAAALFLLLESVLPAIFPWHLGYPWLWAGWPGFQLADLIGFEGLNVAAVFVNALLASAWLARARLRAAGGFAAAAIALSLGLNAAGALRGASAAPAPDAQLNVLVVQGNVGNYEKHYAHKGAAFQADIFERYAKLTRDGLALHPEAEAVLWPETAFPDLLDRPFLDRPNPAALRAFAREIKRTIFTGAYSEDSKRLAYNGLFAIGPDGEAIGGGYRKTILLAFGEYVPFSRFFPWIFDLIPTISSFGRGPGPMTIEAAGAKIGPQICYEGLYPDFTAELANKGAEIVLNVTNDSWFGEDFEPRQHLYMTLARAVETRRPLVRATNTGISTAILADGTVLQKSPQNQEWSGLFKIPYRRSPPETLYQKIEWAWPWLLAIASGLVVAFAGRFRPWETSRT